MSEAAKPRRRYILHVDMNAFYCSVHVAHEPGKYRGKPIAVGGSTEERRGILVTASYECRAKGVRAAMPIWQARKLCPEMIVIPPDFELYRDYSRRMFALLQQYTALAEGASIDEAYLDVTDSGEHGTPVEIAEAIQRRLREELGLPCSIGIAPNKFLAKMASNMKKPNAITILRKRDLPAVLWPLPIRDMHGVGKKLEEKLKAMSIATIGDLASAPLERLRTELGKTGAVLWKHAQGEDDQPVDPESMYEVKTIGNSTTLPRDIEVAAELEPVLRKLAESVSGRMRKKRLPRRKYPGHHSLCRLENGTALRACGAAYGRR